MDFPLPATSEAILGSNLGLDPSWMEPADNMDWVSCPRIWTFSKKISPLCHKEGDHIRSEQRANLGHQRFLDVSLAHSHTAGTNSASGASWVEKLPLDELDMLDPGLWGRPSGEAHRHFPSR